jgi:predicted nucleotidyltransferase
VVGPTGRKIRSLARQFHAANPWIFGSVARGESTVDSDVDFVVRFGDNANLLDHIGLRTALVDLLRRPVDVVDETALHWYIRPQILSDAIPV